jgi:hypothetical protein
MLLAMVSFNNLGTFTQGQVDKGSDITYLPLLWRHNGCYDGCVFYHSLDIYLLSDNALQETCRPCVGLHTVRGGGG